MSDKPIPRTPLLMADLQVPFKYTVIHGADPGRKSAQQRAVTKSLNLQGLIFESPTVEIAGFHISFTETTYGRNSLEISMDLGRRYGAIEAIGQVEWYERRSTVFGTTFIIGVTFIDVQADAMALLREFLQHSRGTAGRKDRL
jgi:hypothetical protein